MKNLIINAKTDESYYEDLTEDEIAEIKASHQAFLAAEAEAKAKKEALLARLGITEEEAKLLLG